MKDSFLSLWSGCWYCSGGICEPKGPLCPDKSLSLIDLSEDGRLKIKGEYDRPYLAGIGMLSRLRWPGAVR